MKSIRGIVFEGGGPRGLALIGVARALEEYNLKQQLKYFGGTSVGAIFAMLLALGYSYNEIREKTLSKNFSEFLDIYSIFNINQLVAGIGNATGMSMMQIAFKMLVKLWEEADKKKGIFTKKKLVDFLETCIQYKGFPKTLTFAQLFDKTGNTLNVVTSNLSRGIEVVLGLNASKDVQIVQGVFMSACIPILFEPVNFDGELYADGGIFNNYSINMYDSELPYSSVLGFRLSDTASMHRLQGRVPASVPINNVVSLCTRLLTAFYSSQDKKSFIVQNLKRTVVINCGDVNLFSFILQPHEKEKLIESGYKATKEHVEKLVRIDSSQPLKVIGQGLRSSL